MLYGTVKYVLKSDPEGEVEVQWAGQVVFDFAEGVRMRFYQVYLVSLFSILCFDVGDMEGRGVGYAGATAVLMVYCTGSVCSVRKEIVWGFSGICRGVSSWSS